MRERGQSMMLASGRRMKIQNCLYILSYELVHISAWLEIIVIPMPLPNLRRENQSCACQVTYRPLLGVDSAGSRLTSTSFDQLRRPTFISALLPRRRSLDFAELDCVLFPAPKPTRARKRHSSPKFQHNAMGRWGLTSNTNMRRTRLLLSCNLTSDSLDFDSRNQ